MSNLSIISNNSLTMSSREIAELVDSRHDSVKRTIETLVGKGVIVQPQSVDEPGTDAMGRPRVTQVFLFSGEKGKRDSIVVVAQLSPEFTARLVDRWQELESKQSLIPQTLPEALRLAADLAEQKAQAVAALAIAAPKADALDRIATADGALCITNAAKTLQVQPKALFSWLQANDWIYRRPGSGAFVAYQDRIKQGLMTHKITTVERSDGSEKTVEQALVTAKGMTKLAAQMQVA